LGCTVTKFVLEEGQNGGGILVGVWLHGFTVVGVYW